ncbi:archease [Trichloromonas sp.]|uniref:archease n=1 Tax=Trichloromonas sp. TaxID=3069249 RepID=UPI002A4B7958|nr:archease [Trichloromonas sp.]
MGAFRLLAHTADMGIAATGDSLAELFVAAANGLTEIIFDDVAVDSRQSAPVSLAGGDSGELLVAWLGEILYLFEVHGLVPAEFVIHEISEKTLRGEVRGEPFDPERHPVAREVKAVTYHQLSVEGNDQGWQARVYVDL